MIVKKKRSKEDEEFDEKLKSLGIATILASGGAAGIGIAADHYLKKDPSLGKYVSHDLSVLKRVGGIGAVAGTGMLGYRAYRRRNEE